MLERFALLPADCGNDENPGVDEIPEWQDYSWRESTEDQLRIEEVLAKEQIGFGGVLLHVGTGNSKLAQRFSPAYRLILGITIQPNEFRRANKLSIANYESRLFNKYHEGLAQLFPGPVDVIVDNNPTTFACCRRHVGNMMRSYCTLLGASGVIVSDRLGLGWTTIPNDKKWGLSVEEWFELGRAYGLEGAFYSDQVVGLRRAA